MTHNPDDDQLFNLAKSIAASRNLTIADLRGSCRKTELVNARAEFAYHGKLLGASYPQLGRTIDKHHTTLLMGVRRWEKLIGVTA